MPGMSDEKTAGPGGRRCDGCLAWQPWSQQPEPVGSSGRGGQCRLRSATLMRAGDEFRFPRTYASDWCLEHRPRDSERTVPVGEQKVRVTPGPMEELSDWDGKVRC